MFVDIILQINNNLSIRRTTILFHSRDNSAFRGPMYPNRYAATLRI
jgi:hypothetical protein